MANLLNKLECYGQRGGNTGTSDCDIEPGLMTSFTFLTSGSTFDLEDQESPEAFVAAIQARLLADNPLQRIYYIGAFEEVTPNGEAPVVQTYGYGRKRQVRRGTVAYDFLVTGGKGKHREQLKFSGAKGDVLLHDSNNVTWGTTVTNGDGDRLMKGYRLSNLFVGDYQNPNGQTGGQWVVTIEFSETAQLQENYAYMKTEEDPFAMGTGFIPVTHEGTTSTGATNLNVMASTLYGVDLIKVFPTELAQTGGAGVFAFLVKNAVAGSPNEGNVITIASVVATGNDWIVTLAATGVDPDNPGTGGKVSVELNTPAVLRAFTNPVIGLITPKPAIVTLG